MRRDDRGLELTTSSADAAEALSRAATSLVGHRLDAMAHVNAALDADPGCVLAHAMKGLLVVGVRLPGRYPEAQAELEAAETASDRANEREKGYLAALSALIRGRTLDAVSHYETILAACPRDLLAHRLVQFELFWIGESAWMRDIVERAAPAWSADVPGFGAFQALRAFGCEENGFHADAERYGRDSVERDPANGWGAHAVAHVMEMQGRDEDGIAWLDGLKGHWSELNNFVHHLWWHRSLFHLSRGEFGAVLEIYDREVRDPESPLIEANPGHYGDFQNAVDLLKRLDMCGCDVGDRWEAIADLAEDRIGNHAAPLSSGHVATALAAAGRDSAVEAYLAALRGYASTDETDNAARVRSAVLPAAEGAIAHQRGDHEAALGHLLPARRGLWRIGGSHAQRDLFTRILADSARRLGRNDVVDILLEEMSRTGFARPAERLRPPGVAKH